MLAIQRFTAVSAIDAAFRLYRAHFRVLFTLSLLVNAPTAAGNVAFTVLAHEAERAVAGGGASLMIVGILGFAALMATVVLSMVAAVFGTGACTDVVSKAATGQPVVLEDALSAALRHFWPLMGASLLTTMAIGFGMLLLIVPGIVLGLGLSLVGPVIVLEGVGVTESIERSWKLSRGRRGKIFVALCLLIMLIVSTSMLVSVVGLLPDVGESLAVQLAETLVAQGLSVLFTPVWYATMVLLYYDGRVDHEAFDVHVLAHAGSDPRP